MQALFAAEETLRVCKGRETELEQRLLHVLETSGPAGRAEVDAIEEELLGARASIAEALAVVDYFRLKGDSSTRTDLYRVVVHSQHPTDEAPVLSSDAWSSLVMRWSEANSKIGVTGMLMTTGLVHFLILEGKQEATNAILKRVLGDTRHRHATLLSVAKIEAREFLFGLKLHYVEDAILAAVLTQAQTGIIQSSSYAPQAAREFVAHGGDPEGIVPEHHHETIALAVTLDMLGGAQHTGEDYRAAARAIDRIGQANGATIVERFGDATLMVFPWSHGTAAITAAKAIRDEVASTIVAVATGPSVTVSSPVCWALGSALLDAKKLVFLAENERRPLLITSGAMERSSRAVHKFFSLTINNKPYYTLQSIGEDRLLREQVVEEIVPQYSGMVPVIVAGSNVTEYRPMTHQELVEKGLHEAVVRGALTKDKVMEWFRVLDPGNSGFVSKEGTIRWLASGDAPYAIFEDVEWAHIKKWMAKNNALGPKLLNFDEFRSLCLMLERR